MLFRVQFERHLQHISKRFDVVCFECAFDPKSADLGIAKFDLLATVAIELLSRIGERGIAEHHHAVTPTQPCLQDRNRLLDESDPFMGGQDFVARRHFKRGNTDAGLRGFKTRAPFDQRDEHAVGIAAHGKFRAQIRDPVVAGCHHERMFGIVPHLKIRFSSVERDGPRIFIEANAYCRVGIEFDLGAVTEDDLLSSANWCFERLLM